MVLIIFWCSSDSSWSNTDNPKNNFSVLGEEPTDDINDSVCTAERKLSINFSKAKTKFCLSLNYNDFNSYLFVTWKKIKADIKNFKFPSHFCIGSISKEFYLNESKGVYFKGNVCGNFIRNHSVDSKIIDKSNTLNIHKYLMVKNNIK